MTRLKKEELDAYNRLGFSGRLETREKRYWDNLQETDGYYLLSQEQFDFISPLPSLNPGEIPAINQTGTALEYSGVTVQANGDVVFDNIIRAPQAIFNDNSISLGSLFISNGRRNLVIQNAGDNDRVYFHPYIENFDSGTVKVERFETKERGTLSAQPNRPITKTIPLVDGVAKLQFSFSAGVNRYNYSATFDTPTGIQNGDLIVSVVGFEDDNPVYKWTRANNLQGNTIPASDAAVWTFGSGSSGQEEFGFLFEANQTSFVTLESPASFDIKGIEIAGNFIPYFLLDTQEVVFLVMADVDGETFTDTVVNGVRPNDNYIELGVDYSTVASREGGIAHNYLPTSTTDTVTEEDFTAGVASTSNPTVITDGSGTFSQDDIILISGTEKNKNDGFFEVEDHTGTTLTIRGVGTIPVVETFTKSDFLASVDTATITKVNVSILKSSVDGDWERGKGSTTGINYLPLSNSVASIFRSTASGSAAQTLTSTPTNFTDWTGDGPDSGNLTSDQANNEITIDEVFDTVNGDLYEVAASITWEAGAGNTLNFEIVYDDGVSDIFTDVRVTHKIATGSANEVANTVIGQFRGPTSITGNGAIKLYWSSPDTGTVDFYSTRLTAKRINV